MPTEFMFPSGLFQLLDVLSSIAFAATGALVASRKQLDLVGFCWLAVFTGIGGGTVRDLLLDQPVFWVVEPLAIEVCLLTAVVVYFIAPVIESRYRFMLWFDAFGMAMVTVVGTAKGLAVGAPPVVAIAMGVVTASVGGIIRDTIGQEQSVILKREINVTASVAGALIYVLLAMLGMPQPWLSLLAFIVAFTVRGAALVLDLQMPRYRARPGRDYGDS